MGNAATCACSSQRAKTRQQRRSQPEAGRPSPVAVATHSSGQNGQQAGQLAHSGGGQQRSTWRTPMGAIRAHCLECVCGQRREVELCPASSCALYPFRFGVRPATARAQDKAVTPKRREVAASEQRRP